MGGHTLKFQSIQKLKRWNYMIYNVYYVGLSDEILPMSVDFELAQHRYRRLALARRYTSLIDINTDRNRRRTNGKCKRSDGCTFVATSRVRS